MEASSQTASTRGTNGQSIPVDLINRRIPMIGNDVGYMASFYAQAGDSPCGYGHDGLLDRFKAN